MSSRFDNSCISQDPVFRNDTNVWLDLLSYIITSPAIFDQFECLKRDVWITPCENVSRRICGQRRPRSACASAQSDQGLRCPLTETSDIIECINEEQMPRWDFAHAWDESESVLFAHGRRHVFAWRGSFEHVVHEMSVTLFNDWNGQTSANSAIF